MNGDSLTIMSAISDMRAELLAEISDVKSSVSGLDGKLTANLEAVKETHDAFHEELLGPGGRVTSVEEDQKTNQRRQWIITACVIPIVSALHYLASKFGMIK